MDTQRTKHSAKYYLTARSPIFKDLTEQEILYLTEKVTLEEIIKGQQIYRKGEIETSIHILTSGVVHVVRRFEEIDNPIEVFRRGELVGMVSFFTESAHSFDAYAVTEVKALRIEKKDFEEIVKKIPSLGIKFSGLLSCRLRNIRNRDKIAIRNRVIGFISILDDLYTEKIINKTREFLESKNNVKVLNMAITFAPSKTNKSMEDNVFELDSQFSLHLENYLDEYDLVFLKIARFDLERIQQIEKELDKVFILCEETSLPLNLQDIIEKSEYKSIYTKKFINKSLHEQAFHSRIAILGREILDKRIGLALGGGAALGLAQIGILKVLERENISIDMVSGTSIGSLIGGFWCSGISAQELEDICIDFDSAFKMFRFVDVAIPTSGLISGNKLLGFLEEKLKGMTFEKTNIPFRAVACDIRKREELVLKEGRVSDAIRMSTAIPGVFTPVVKENKQIVDGGIVNPLPVSVLADEGIKRIIAVNSMPSSDVIMKSNKETQGIMDIMINSLYSLQYRIGKYASNQVDVYMNPILENSSWYEFYRAKEFIEFGERVTEKLLPEIRKIMI